MAPPEVFNIRFGGIWTLAMTARTKAAVAIAGLISLMAAASALAQAPIPSSLGDPLAPRSDAEIDAAFQCPEALSDDKARRQALVDYFHSVQRLHPDWSVAQTVEFKKTLLVHHRCADSLRDLADYAKREYR
jgi:hypothetical protein